MGSAEPEIKTLPERAFPMQDHEKEQTKVFWHTLGPDKPTLVTGFRDPGITNAILPVLKRLFGEMNIGVFTDSRGEELLIKSGLDFKLGEIGLSPALAISQAIDKADVVLTGVSVMPGPELTLIANTRFENLQEPTKKPVVIGLEDYPGLFARQMYTQLNTPGWVVPDYLLVVSDWAKREELKNLPAGFNPDRVIVTGQPSLDRLVSEDTSKVRQEVRKRLNIGEGETFIAYMGTADIPGETNSTLRLLIEALAKTAPANYRLTLRPHPRDYTKPEIYDQTFEPARDKRIHTEELTTDQVGMAADLVISNGSTTGIDAVYRGIPSLNVMISENGFPLPTAEDEASLLATTSQSLQEILEKFFHDPSYLEILKQKMAGWKIDGHATERVANFVLKAAKDHIKKKRRA